MVSVRFEIERRSALDPALASVVQTRVGRPLAMSDVRQTIVHLFSLGRFDDVKVHASANGGGVELLYELAPNHPVHRLAFAGTIEEPGIDVGRLRRAVVERFGETPSAARAADVARLIEAELADRGYLHATVSPRVQLEHAPDRATLVLSIAAGPRTVIGDVEVVGSPAVPTPQFLERFGVAKGSPYEREILAARVEQYLADQRGRGYYEARLTTAARLADGDRIANLTLNVAAGSRVRVVFTGDALPADVRDQLVPIAREGSADEDLLEDSTIRIEDYLRAQGYRDAAAPHTRETANGEIVVTFAVKRGRQYRVAEVAISGNAFFTTSALEEMLRLGPGQPFQTARLDADIAAIQDLYRRRGFAAVNVASTVEPAPAEGSDDVPVVVRLAITENPQVIVGSVSVAGNASVPQRELVEDLGLRPGSEFFLTQMALDRDAVQLKYANLGYLNATVDANPGIAADGRRADIVYTVHEGPRMFVDHILIVGNERTRTETIERELQVKPGDPLGLAAITESQRRLTALGLFRRTRIAQLTHGDETTRDLLVTVDEAPPTTVGYGGGLELGPRIRQEGGAGGFAAERQELAPRAFFEITRRNLFGKNRSVNLFTRVSVGPHSAASDSGYGFSEYRVLGTFREPRVFGTGADAFLTGTTEQQIRSSFNFARRAFTAEAGQRLTRALSVSGSYQIQTTELFDEQINEDDRPIIDRVFPQILLSSFSASAIHDTRDDQLDPTTGQYFSLNGQLAGRRIGSEVGFAKSFVAAQIFRALPRSPRVVLAASARLGTAAPFPRDVPEIDDSGARVVSASGEPVMKVIKELPASERFFAGGDTTVRGFALDQLGVAGQTLDQNAFPIGGNALVIFNAELRVPIRTGFGVVGFFDSGNVFARTSNIDLGQLRSAVGFGFRYRSPVGPIRVDIGFKVNRHEIKPGQLEPRHAWHITLGQAF